MKFLKIDNLKKKVLENAGKINESEFFNNLDFVKKEKEKRLRIQREKEEALRLQKEKEEQERKRSFNQFSGTMLAIIMMLVFMLLNGNSMGSNTTNISKTTPQEATVSKSQVEIEENKNEVIETTPMVAVEKKVEEPKVVLNNINSVLDYNTGVFDTLDLISVKYGDVKWDKEESDSAITVVPSIESIDTSEIGEYQVDYEVSIDGKDATEHFTKEFVVKDRYSPKVNLGNSQISVENGAYFNPLDNIVELVDNNNNYFTYLNEQPTEPVDYNWYTVTSDVNTTVAGVYTVKVIAGDSYGNTATRTYKVNVNEPVVVQAPVVQEVVREAAPQVSYILNTNTYKFHYPSCGSVSKMKEHNKWYFTGTRDEVISMGYSPCGNCHP